MCLSSGTFIFDTIAMFEGLLSNDSTFLRTPKAGDAKEIKFNFFETQESQVVRESTHTPNQSVTQRWRVLKEVFYFAAGISFAIYLGIVPFLDLFLWDWSTKTLSQNLTPLGLIIPAVGFSTYHSFVFYEVNASFGVTTPFPPLKRKKRINQHFLRNLTLLMAAINTYSISTVTFATVGTLKELRLSGHLTDQSHLSPISNQAFSEPKYSENGRKYHDSQHKNILPGYCSW